MAKRKPRADYLDSLQRFAKTAWVANVPNRRRKQAASGVKFFAIDELSLAIKAANRVLKNGGDLQSMKAGVAVGMAFSKAMEDCSRTSEFNGQSGVAASKRVRAKLSEAEWLESIGNVSTDVAAGNTPHHASVRESQRLAALGVTVNPSTIQNRHRKYVEKYRK